MNPSGKLAIASDFTSGLVTMTVNNGSFSTVVSLLPEQAESLAKTLSLAACALRPS